MHDQRSWLFKFYYAWIFFPFLQKKSLRTIFMTTQKYGIFLFISYLWQFLQNQGFLVSISSGNEIQVLILRFRSCNCLVIRYSSITLLGIIISSSSANVWQLCLQKCTFSHFLLTFFPFPWTE